MVSTAGLLILCFLYVVGRESVLAVAGTREVRCGRRLVSGLFARPRLPLGYSYVTTVPRGACRLNVSEIVPSENYIALKLSNSSYIMNGEFAVSTTGVYEAAGARFIYTRTAGLDSIFARGPIHHPIDIMILYTQPNPSLKYAYFTESQPGEVEETTSEVTPPDGLSVDVPNRHSRRHHASNTSRQPELSKDEVSEEDDIEENVIGERRFAWKILFYSQCTRSCGGGIQVGKYRCVEVYDGMDDREVSPVHCTGIQPAAERRRCSNTPCPPRWRTAAWSTCPSCGPATRTRLVGCVQDHFRGITKISDQKCSEPKPATVESCNIPNCQGDNDITKTLESNQGEPKDQIDTFRDGPVYSVTLNSTEFGPVHNYGGKAPAGWLYTEWSQCVGWCIGEGVQTRGIRCADPSGCTPRKAPEQTQSCSPIMSCDPKEGQWFTGEWSECSSLCKGRQVRGVLCVSANGRRLRDNACKTAKPELVRECGNECLPTWFYSDWSQCIGNCSSARGVQRRTVWCASGTDADPDAEKGTAAAMEVACLGPRPPAERVCTPKCAATSASAPNDTTESEKTEKASEDSVEVVEDEETKSKECEDKLRNCALAVQARLCNYNYYVKNCCNSCKGR